MTDNQTDETGQDVVDTIQYDAQDYEEEKVDAYYQNLSEIFGQQDAAVASGLAQLEELGQEALDSLVAGGIL